MRDRTVMTTKSGRVTVIRAGGTRCPVWMLIVREGKFSQQSYVHVFTMKRTFLHKITGDDMSPRVVGDELNSIIRWLARYGQ